MTSTSTKRNGRAEKRDRIIDAATEVFAAKGFHSARISDIARLAGVADGTIYLYFKNKEDLLFSIFEEKMEALLTEHGRRAIGSDSTGSERIFVVRSLVAEVNSSKAKAFP